MYYPSQRSFGHGGYAGDAGYSGYGGYGYGAYGEQAPAPVTRPCPRGASMARDRCTNGPVPCPAIPNLLCVSSVSGLTFSYVDSVARNSTTGLWEPGRTFPNRQQNIIPGSVTALQQFIANMGRFNMNIDLIYTVGSLYCRCVSGTNSLSNHSFGEAVDVVGVRWVNPAAVGSRARHTIVHNWQDAEQRRILRRINACLRLSFATVIDYHRADHRDHFHCDLNRGRGRPLRGASTLSFVQEALSLALGRRVPEDGAWNGVTQQALRDYLRLPAGAALPPLNPVFDRLFTQIASTP